MVAAVKSAAEPAPSQFASATKTGVGRRVGVGVAVAVIDGVAVVVAGRVTVAVGVGACTVVAAARPDGRNKSIVATARYADRRDAVV